MTGTQGLLVVRKARSQAGTLYSVDWKPSPFSRIFIRGVHGLRQYRRQRPKGEHVLHCDGKLKRSCHTQGFSKNAQLQATVNYSCLCSLHFVMLVTNAKNERSSSEAALP
jgi:hypothetical protein